MTNVAVIMICLVCVAYLYGVDYLLDLTDKEMSRILKCEKERRISAMAETKREIYIRKIEEILRHENMAICHEAFFSEDVISNILELLKEEPERDKGKWIHNNPNTFRCSKCNKYLDIFFGNMKMNFCPNCGADMRGE